LRATISAEHYYIIEGIIGTIKKKIKPSFEGFIQNRISNSLTTTESAIQFC
jgi:hypothetical protein